MQSELLVRGGFTVSCTETAYEPSVPDLQMSALVYSGMPMAMCMSGVLHTGAWSCQCACKGLTSRHLMRCSLPALTISLSSLDMSCFLLSPWVAGSSSFYISYFLQRSAGICTQADCTMEAEAFSPYSSMMLLVSLPSISSGTETFTALPGLRLMVKQSAHLR